ncbi:MAG: hypothetical protein WC356_05380 [Candidatus Micrarchaeia archaeon]|jgi:hypothetical protein
MNKIMSILLILGIMISFSYAAECKGDLCCEGDDSGYKYFTGNCADTDKDPSLAGKFCSSGEWYDYAVKCGCPAGYTTDTSDTEDGECVKTTVKEEPKEEVKEEIKETTNELEKEIIPETTVEIENKELDKYYKYAPVNAIEDSKGQGCGLSTIIIAGVLGLIGLAYKH